MQITNFSLVCTSLSFEHAETERLQRAGLDYECSTGFEKVPDDASCSLALQRGAAEKTDGIHPPTFDY